MGNGGLRYFPELITNRSQKAFYFVPHGGWVGVHWKVSAVWDFSQPYAIGLQLLEIGQAAILITIHEHPGTRQIQKLVHQMIVVG